MIDNTLYDAFGQRQVSTMFTELNEYHLVMEVAPEFQTNPDALKHIYVHSTNGTQVPLSAFSHYEPKTTPLTVNHQGQFPAITLSFNLAPGVALGRAVTAVNRRRNQMGLPATIAATFQGTAQAFQASLANEPILILAALVAVYIVLGMLYESYIHPITILSTLPSAGVGALLAILIDAPGSERDVDHRHHPADWYREEKRHHDDRLRAGCSSARKEERRAKRFTEACLLRFRPDHDDHDGRAAGRLCLWLSARAQVRELRRPLGISIVGGLMVSQMLTLFTTPVVYLYMDRLRAMARQERSQVRVPLPRDLGPSSLPHPRG